MRAIGTPNLRAIGTLNAGASFGEKRGLWVRKITIFFAVFVFCKKNQKKCFFRKLPAGGFATTKRRVLGDHNH